LNLGVGLVVGVALGMGAAYARQAMDSRVRDAEVLEDITSLPVIGTIANAPRMRTLPVVMQAEPRSPAAEAFRQLRTNLQFLAVPSHVPGGDSELRTVMVTSSLPGEGKSIVAVNLAAALAETSARVLLVDADLRRPSVAGLLGLEGAAGLTTVLLGRASVQDVVQDWGDAGLSVLTTGPLPPNPSEFLSAPAMDAIVRDLRYKYDYVVLDTTPVLPVADAAMLSHSVDGVVVVADVRRVRRHQLTEALHTLAQVNGRTLGVALNRVRHREQLYGARVEGRRRGEVPVRHLGPAAAQGRHSRASDRPQAALGSVDDERSMRQTVQPASQTGDPE
jgi:capsular exopolysaccharide synthesis family protein